MARAWARGSAAGLFLLFLFSSLGDAQPPEPSSPKVSKMTIYNGASRYVTYQVPPDASPHVQALYRALGQAENDQYLTDQLQQLLLDYTEQERILGAVRTSREINYGNAPIDTGSEKANTVLGFVAAAQARTELAGQVNRDLERLQLQVAALKAGPRAGGDALHNEASALRRQRQAWRTYQAASERELAAPAAQRAAAHEATLEAERALQTATRDLHAAQAESLFSLTGQRTAPSSDAAVWLLPAGARPLIPFRQSSQDANRAARARGQRWGLQFNKVSIALAEQAAALAGRGGNNEEQTAWLNERAALLPDPTAWKAVVQALTDQSGSGASAAPAEAIQRLFTDVAARIGGSSGSAAKLSPISIDR